MRKVELTMKEQEKYEIIKHLSELKISKERAIVKLGCTRRSVNRMIKGYKEFGKEYFLHGNRNRIPQNKIPQSIRDKIAALYMNDYYGSNYRHFSELLKDKEGIEISEVSVRNILLEKNIISPKSNRIARRKLKKRMRQLNKNTKSEVNNSDSLLTTQEVMEPHPRREKSKYEGEMIQMDASPHIWFGNSKTSLHAAIDDATGAIVGAYFQKEETLKGYYEIFRQILSTYGIPAMFYTDRRAVFIFNSGKRKDISKDTYAQFGYACKKLGVDIEVTSVPQAKGKIERLFGALQSRLPIEMKLANITTIEEANEFLNEYIKKFNNRFAIQSDSIKSAYISPISEEEINLTLSIIQTRKIDNGHCIKYNHKYYKLLNSKGRQVYCPPRTSALVIKTLNGDLYASVNGVLHVLKIVKEHETSSRYVDNISKSYSETLTEHKLPKIGIHWEINNYLSFVDETRKRMKYIDIETV